jgi:hypothetical protein
LSWSKSEERIWNEIKEWELQLHQHEPNDFEMMYEKWVETGFEKLNPKVRERFFTNLDNWIFHLNALLQGSQSQIDARQRIVNEGRIFDNSITDLSEMRKLTIDQLIFISEQQIAKNRLLSFAQGGLSGTGGFIMAGVDLPAMAILNLRSIQHVAMTYGYDVSVPYEMMLSLKVFHLSTLPKRLQAGGWKELVEETEDSSRFRYLYEGEDQVITEAWFEQPMKQLLKSFFIFVFRKKLIQGLPLIGMAIGAAANYQLTRQVTDFAHRFYQLRYLTEKKEVWGEFE